MKKLQTMFKTYFGTGILVLVPLVVTVWIIKGIVDWIDNVFAINQWSPVVVPGLGMILAVIAILIAGMLGRNVIGSWLMANLNEVFNKIPFIGSVYGALRQTMQALFRDGEKKFGRAVLVEYPRAGCWSIGLVTSPAPPVVENALGKGLITVFVPTTPNPTGGFLLYVEESQTKRLDMKVEEAIKLIVSLGLVEGTADSTDLLNKSKKAEMIGN